MGRKSQLGGSRSQRPPMPKYVKKRKGNCAGCGLPVYKRPVKYKKQIWHTPCLVQATKEGKV